MNNQNKEELLQNLGLVKWMPVSLCLDLVEIHSMSEVMQCFAEYEEQSGSRDLIKISQCRSHFKTSTRRLWHTLPDALRRARLKKGQEFTVEVCISAVGWADPPNKRITFICK